MILKITNSFTYTTRDTSVFFGLSVSENNKYKAEIHFMRLLKQFVEEKKEHSNDNSIL